MEPKNNLAISTGDRVNEGIFTSKCMAVLPGGQNKVAEITRCPYYRGGRKAGFTVLLFLLKLASLSLYKLCWQMVSPIVILL